MKLLFTLILNVLYVATFAQINRYIVSFADKDNSTYSTSKPEAFLSEKALERRRKNNIVVNIDDLPVNSDYIQQIDNIEGVDTFFSSRWFNAVLIETKNEYLGAIEKFSFVTSIELVAPRSKLGTKTTIAEIEDKSLSSSPTKVSMLRILDLDVMHDDGFFGKGVIVSVFDSGFSNVDSLPAFKSIFTENQILLTQDLVNNTNDVYQYHYHGTYVLSTIVGKIENQYMGGAPKSKLMLFVTEDVATEYRIEEYNWLFAAEKADSAGTDIIQSSLGYWDFDDPTMDYSMKDLDGKTAVVSKAASMSRDRGIIVVVSAGNSGMALNHSVTPPADSDGILSVGSIDSTGMKSSSSSFGLTSDSRIKPDVCTLGRDVSVINGNGEIIGSSGTSFAAPLITSLVAGLIEANPLMSAVEIIERIKRTSSIGLNPNNELGYGIPSYVAFNDNTPCEYCVENYLKSLNIFDNSKKLIKIYSNPTYSKLNVVFRKPSMEKSKFVILDLTGAVVMDLLIEVSFPNNTIELVLDDLSYGCYLLKVENSTLNEVFRFVKY